MQGGWLAGKTRQRRRDRKQPPPHRHRSINAHTLINARPARHITDGFVIMTHNSYGHLFRVTTWGESHGPAIGCTIDGCPPQIPLALEDIQGELDRRRPGKSRFVTQRRETDTVQILSGIFADDAGIMQTTGAPVCLLIENRDQRSKDYSDIRNVFRPGHADYTWQKKYGIRDYPRRWQILGPRDRLPCCRRCHRPEGDCTRHGARGAGADRPTRDCA